MFPFGGGGFYAPFPLMTPIEKAETALNTRISELQAKLPEASSETAQKSLFQSLVACIGIGEALTDYVRMIGQFANARHGELKQIHGTLTARHAELLKAGQELLERLKANPSDRALRKEIEAVQTAMAAIQTKLKRGANALQRDTAPGIAMLDPLALGVRQLAEAGHLDTLKRAIKTIVGTVDEFYHAQPSLPAKDIIDAPAWEKSAVSEIEQASDSHGAYTRAAYHAMLGLDTMTMALSDAPARTADEAISRAQKSVATRVQAITARFTTS